jgi:hypothetical protein
MGIEPLLLKERIHQVHTLYIAGLHGPQTQLRGVVADIKTRSVCDTRDLTSTYGTATFADRKA